MGRKKLNFNKFVSYDEKTNKSTCLMKNCCRVFHGIKSYSIKRHFKLVHKKIIDEDTIKQKMHSIQKTNSDIVSSKIKGKIQIDMDKKEFLKCCVGLGVIKNISFRIFDDNDFFKELIKPYEKKFKININSSNFKFGVETASKEIKKLISKSVENKIISLNLDVDSRMGRKILSINIQYIEDFQLYSNAIGMIEVTKQSTLKNIRDEILRCLQEVGIKKSHVYANTNYINNIKDSDLEKVEVFSQIDKLFSVLQCTAYILRFAADEVLKKVEVEVNECRKLAKKLRNSRIENLSFDIPNFNNVTRWETIYSIVECLLFQRDYVEAVTELMSIEVNWKFIEDFASAFKPFFVCSSKSQNEQYVLGDFYRDWLSCELELEDILDNCCARYLHEAMSHKKTELFNHKTFVAALYLDPRFNFENSPLLTDYQKEIGLDHILETYEVCKELEVIKIADSEHVNQSNPANTPSTSKNSFDKLTQHIQKMITAKNSKSFTSKDLRDKLVLLRERNREPLHINILEYWKTGYQNEPELCKLVEVIISAPASQVSKGSFSALSTTLKNLGNNAPKELLEHVLLCKLNFDLLENYDLLYSAVGLNQNDLI